MLQFPEARLSRLTHNRSQKGAVGKPPESALWGGAWPGPPCFRDQLWVRRPLHMEKKWSSLMICRWRCAPEVFQLEVPLVNTSLREVTGRRCGKGLQCASLPLPTEGLCSAEEARTEANLSLQTCDFRSSLAKSCPTRCDRAYSTLGLLHGAEPCGGEGLVELNEAVSHAV